MKKIGIICALSSELELIKNNLTNLEEKDLKGGKYFIGKIGEVAVYCTVASIGKVNAAIKTQIIIDNFDVDCVINTGIAGSLSKKAGHLSIVVGQSVFYHDFDNSLFKRFYPFKEKFVCSHILVEKYLKANEKRSDIVIGNIATGDQFVSSNEKKKQISQMFGAIACEMEGAAIGHTAFVNGVDFLVLRCISDMADDDADMTYDTFEKIAADKVSQTVVNMLKTL